MIINKEKGFTLIEIAIVMVIIGLLMGGGVSIFRVLNERTTRNNTIDYLKEVKEALITYADIHGKLPNADTDSDGLPNGTSTVGTIPYVTIGVQPKDSWSRILKYEVNASLCADMKSTCSALRIGFSSGDRPEVVDADGGTLVLAVAAVIVSAGPMDADSDGNVFDDITSLGDNTDGTPYYVRNPPIEVPIGNAFDDLATYIGANELYGNICECPVLAVNNRSGSGYPMVYVYSYTQVSDIGTIAEGGTWSDNIPSGTRIAIFDDSGGPSGSGSIVPSSGPPTPITLSGQGCQIDIPGEYLVLKVINGLASSVYVYNETLSVDIDDVDSNPNVVAGATSYYNILRGTRIAIYSDSGGPSGSGSIVPSITTLSGERCTITIP